MTDNEIIENLECCMEGECEKCTYQDVTACKEYIFHDCLDLINHQKAKIGMLKGQVDAKIDGNFSLTIIKSAKSEAIREFARRLIEEIDAINYKEYNNYLDTLDIIERVAEEMECETNEMQNTESD